MTTNNIILPADFNVNEFIYVGKQGVKSNKHEYDKKLAEYIEQLTNETGAEIKRIVDAKYTQLRKENLALHRKSYSRGRKELQKLDRKKSTECFVELLSIINKLLENTNDQQIRTTDSNELENTNDQQIRTTDSNEVYSGKDLAELVAKLESNENRGYKLSSKCKLYLETFSLDTRVRKRAVMTLIIILKRIISTGIIIKCIIS
jgi:hypothetical protein